MAVVGTCTDCIISLPPQPKTSMKFSIEVSEGFNAVIKRVGTVIGYYPSDNVTTESVQLTPGSSYTWIQGFGAVCIGTSLPVQATTAFNTIVNTFNIQSVFVSDQGFTSITITNPLNATQTANVAIFYTTPPSSTNP